MTISYESGPLSQHSAHLMAMSEKRVALSAPKRRVARTLAASSTPPRCMMSGTAGESPASIWRTGTRSVTGCVSRSGYADIVQTAAAAIREGLQRQGGSSDKHGTVMLAMLTNA